MSEVRAGRAKRALSVGSLSGAIGGRYLWELMSRPFRSDDSAKESLLDAHIRNAERLIEGSTELRGAFTKLVQMLSMRSDLLPAEAIDVLAAARSDVPPMPYADVCEVVEAELGRPIDEAFATFERSAVAAASLGQVHRATLDDGSPVAVKVQYPGISTSVGQDVKNVKALIRIGARIAKDVIGQDVDTDEVAAELEERLLEELDYEGEADRLERFRALVADDDEVVVPHVHRELSSKRVLTMAWADGYPIEDIMAPGVDQELKDWCCEKLYRLFYRQLLEFGVVQTDPHPGNYLVTHHPRLVMLDFGSVRVLDDDVRRGYRALAEGLVADDKAAIAEAGRALGFVADDPRTFVHLMRIAGEPLRVDAPYDPSDYDLLEHANKALEIKLGGPPLLAPGHHVFISRALLGIDGYLKAFGTVRNWHRLLREILEDLPDE